MHANWRLASPIDFRAMPRVLINTLSLFLAIWAGCHVLGQATSSDDQATGPTPGLRETPRAIELLTEFIRAVGGEAAIHNITSMEVQGRIHLPGGQESGTFLWLVANGGRACFRTTFPELGSSAFGSDGTIGWSHLELPGTHTVDPMPMDQVDEKRRRANWFELAFTLPDRAKTMKTVGPTTFGGVPAWEISVERTDGRIEQLFLNQTSKRLIGFRTPLDATPSAPVITVRFGEWRPVGDLILFHRIEISGGRSRVGLEITSIRLDSLSLDDPRFKSPQIPEDTKR